MSRRCILRLVGVSVWAVVCAQITAGGGLYAQNAPQSKDVTASQEANARIAQLIKELDSDAFQTRQRASRELDKLGGQVIPEVTKALAHASAEVQARCLLLLTNCWRSPDESTRQAARRALKQLERSENSEVAVYAKRMLDPPKTKQSKGPQFGGNVVQRVRAAAFANRGRSVRMSNTNGVQSIHIEENGKAIDVKQNPQGAIKVKVTETVNGKQQVSDYAADSAEELKKKHPDGFKTYKYAQSMIDNNNKLQQRIQLQLRARGRGFARPNLATQARSLQQAQQQIDAALKHMRILIKQTPLPEQEIQKQLNQIEAARNTLEELHKKLVVPAESLPSPFKPLPQPDEPPAGTKGK
ncbi:MAG: hypothetical protein ABGZ17_01870 [Planctomycetaceae bacterium]